MSTLQDALETWPLRVMLLFLAVCVGGLLFKQDLKPTLATPTAVAAVPASDTTNTDIDSALKMALPLYYEIAYQKSNRTGSYRPCDPVPVELKALRLQLLVARIPPHKLPAIVNLIANEGIAFTCEVQP